MFRLFFCSMSRSSFIFFAALQSFIAFIDALSWSTVSINGTSAPAARGGHAGVELGGAFYVFGGSGSDATYFNDLTSFSFLTSSWSQVQSYGDRPEKRGGHSSSLVGPSLVIYGGEDNLGSHSDVYKLDFSEKNWLMGRIVDDVRPPSRAYHAAESDGTGMVFIFGGYSQVPFTNLQRNLLTLERGLF
eukprot:Selendium_serpulae@DN3770_c0_g1_i1.p2